MGQFETDFAALKYAGYASPSERGVNANPGDYDNGFSFKGFAPGMVGRSLWIYPRNLN